VPNDEIDFDALEAEVGGEGIKSLRTAYTKLKQENSTLKTEVQTFRAEKRTTSVAQALKSKGLPEAAASLYTGDDTSEEKLTEFANGLAAMFNIQPQTTEGAGEQPTPDPAAAAQSRIDAAQSGGAVPSGAQHLESQIKGAKSAADVLALISQGG
jgi:hypothetical protein